jgi:ATP-dependent DNA helicase RecG
MTMVRGRLVSGTAEIPVVWFNRPYLKSQVDGSAEYLVHGVVRSRGEGWELVNPSLEIADRARLAGRIVPVYAAAGKVSPNHVRGFVSNVLDSGIIGHIEEQLPHWLLAKYDLPPLDEALWNLHRPDPDGDVELLNSFSTRYHSRLIYEEALRLQLQLGLMRSRIIENPKGHCYDLGDAAADRLSRMLPFELTGAQERVVGEILEDLTSPFPMMRLLQGDVGCGKTAVAAIAMAAAAESGLQAALMAPTELLAEQHLLSLKGMLGERFPVALLSASAEGRDQTRASIAAGSVKVVVGTHALIQAGVQFANLGLVVVDEQHRFGVAQRRELQHKGDRPDLLVMTATPIPRSLTMTFYGDLALSIIDELPPGRAPVETRVVSHDKREGVYSWLESELGQGARAYVVIPLIDESSKVQAESIAGLGRQLAERLDRFKPAVLHGRMTSEERAGVPPEAAAFSSQRLSSRLVSTYLKQQSWSSRVASVLVSLSFISYGVELGVEAESLRAWRSTARRVRRVCVDSRCFTQQQTVSRSPRRIWRFVVLEICSARGSQEFQLCASSTLRAIATGSRRLVRTHGSCSHLLRSGQKRWPLALEAWQHTIVWLEPE